MKHPLAGSLMNYALNLFFLERSAFDLIKGLFRSLREETDDDKRQFGRLAC